MEKNSPIGFLRSHDFFKGFVVAVLAGVLQFIYEVIQHKGLSFTSEDLMAIANIAVGSGVAYLIKNLLTDENGKVGGIK